MDPKLAAAALLVEAALVDGVYVNIESDMIAEILLEAFDLEADKVDALIAEGETLAEEAVDSFNFTRHVKKLSMETRVSVIEGLYAWPCPMVNAAMRKMPSSAMSPRCSMSTMWPAPGLASGRKRAALHKAKHTVQDAALTAPFPRAISPVHKSSEEAFRP